ncbi:hypothetical protein ABEB36_009054 [Hypothenemus hampei]|uniref:Uncharacterized protein n=1 Tax=Hypothenemus hampei TaxID=57062 RepID=A0ABD1ENY9_HYPHA
MTCFVKKIYIIPITILIIFKIVKKLRTGWCRSNVCLVGKNAIVTGANSGIGYETAEDFAKRGARVILACRDKIKGQETVERIIKATDNKNIIFKPLDLSSFESIREFTRDIKTNEKRLDILVNNAGGAFYGKATVENNILLVMMTNYFGPFLLTNLLLDFIKTENARIVNVSSIAAKTAREFDINKLNVYPDVLFSEHDLYARSKLCNILFTIELAAKLRGTSVTTYSLHPGVVSTNISRRLNPWIKCIDNVLRKIFFKNSIEGAQTTIYCSVAKGIESSSGEFFCDCRLKQRFKRTRDPYLPGKLWKISEDIVQLKKYS